MVLLNHPPSSSSSIPTIYLFPAFVVGTLNIALCSAVSGNAFYLLPNLQVATMTGLSIYLGGGAFSSFLLRRRRSRHGMAQLTNFVGGWLFGSLLASLLTPPLAFFCLSRFFS